MHRWRRDPILVRRLRHRPSMRDIPEAVRAIAKSQHGLVTRAQAITHLSEGVLSRLVGPHGRWQIVVRGVYATFTGELTEEQKLYAAWLYVGNESMLTGIEGCRKWGLRKLPDATKVKFLIPHHHHRQSRGHVLVQRTRFFPQHSVVMDDVPLAPLARCVIDATRDMPSLDDVRSVMMEAVQRRRVTISALQTELEYGAVQWSARARLVIDELILGAHSLPEGKFIRLMASSSILPPMHHNCTLLTPEGDFLAITDGYIKCVGLVGEIQSVEHHVDTDAQDDDMVRRAGLARYDVLAIEARPRRVDKDGPRLVRDFELAYLERLQHGVQPRVLLRCRAECPLIHESDVGPLTPRKAG